MIRLQFELHHYSKQVLDTKDETARGNYWRETYYRTKVSGGKSREQEGESKNKAHIHKIFMSLYREKIGVKIERFRVAKIQLTIKLTYRPF